MFVRIVGALRTVIVRVTLPVHLFCFEHLLYCPPPSFRLQVFDLKVWVQIYSFGVYLRHFLSSIFVQPSRDVTHEIRMIPHRTADSA